MKGRSASRRGNHAVHWDTELGRADSVQIALIDHFSARGLRHVYGRGDHFPGKPVFHMDIWRRRDGVLMARFWSRGNDVDWDSWAVFGFETAVHATGDESWAPEDLRVQYSNWVLANF